MTIEYDKQHYMHTFGDRYPVVFTRGQGAYLYAEDGTAYLDLLGGIAVHALGHCHPHVVERIQQQAATLMHTSNFFYSPNQAALAKALCDVSCADRVFFANTGAEANEGAVKLARLYHYKKGNTHRNEIITFANSFHGRTLAMVAATGQPGYQAPYHPLTPTFTHVPINDVAALEGAITPNTCAMLFEPVLGEGGVFPVDTAFLQKARELCDAHDIVLIFDEVQTGLGRTGHMFGYEYSGVLPDVFTLGKALGGGVPISAIGAHGAFAEVFQKGEHGTTFGGNPLACGAALATLEVFAKEPLVQNSKTLGNVLKQKLEALAAKYSIIADVRGRGLMAAFTLSRDADKVYAALLDRHIIVGLVHGDAIRILPPLNITEQQIHALIDALNDILANLSS